MRLPLRFEGGNEIERTWRHQLTKEVEFPEAFAKVLIAEALSAWIQALKTPSSLNTVLLSVVECLQ